MRGVGLVWHSHSAKHLASATKLFADSSNTANDLHAEFDIPMNRIEVVPAPLDTGFVRSSEFEISEFRKNNDISSEYFWILVSGNEFYKNHSVVVSTFNKLKSEGLPVKILKTGMKSLPVSSPLSTLLIRKTLNAYRWTQLNCPRCIALLIVCCFHPSTKVLAIRWSRLWHVRPP